MPGKLSKLKLRLAREDVSSRVSWALHTGDRSNPYAADERRHLWFDRELQLCLRRDSRFQGLYEAYGAEPPPLKAARSPGLVMDETRLVALHGQPPLRSV